MMPHFLIKVMVKNEMLFTAGHSALFFFFILDGELFVKTRHENRFLSKKAHKHQFVGFQKCLKTPRSSLCVVSSDTAEVLQIDTKKYLEIRDEYRQRWQNFIYQSLPGFRFLGRDDKQLINEIKSITCDRGDVLAYQGEKSDHISLIKSGRCSVVYELDRGQNKIKLKEEFKSVTLDSLGRGQYFGEHGIAVQ